MAPDSCITSYWPEQFRRQPESRAEIDSASCWEELCGGPVRGVDARRRVLAATSTKVLPHQLFSRECR